MLEGLLFPWWAGAGFGIDMILEHHTKYEHWDARLSLLLGETKNLNFGKCMDLTGEPPDGFSYSRSMSYAR